MTQKEKLINEYFTLKNQFEMNEGKETQFDNFIARGDYYYYSKKFKVYELKEMVDNMRIKLERQAKETAVENYFNTEEGAKVKSELNVELEAIKEEVTALKESTNEDIKKLIISTLGDKFTSILHVGYKNCYIEIGIKEDETSLKFGHTFEVRYDDNAKYVNGRWISQYELEMNYPTLGSFNLMEDEDRVAYIFGMGSFANNKKLHEQLIDIFNTYIKLLNMLDEQRNEVEKKLSNPF